MKKIFLSSCIFIQASSAFADYVISVTHLKNGNTTVASEILYYNNMNDCISAAEGLLERSGRHTGGFWQIQKNNGVVNKAYFFHAEAGLNCIVIPSDEFGNE